MKSREANGNLKTCFNPVPHSMLPSGSARHRMQLLTKGRTFYPKALSPDISSQNGAAGEQTAAISLSKMVEAILMIAREPMSARKLAALAELEDATQARSIARQLNEHYDKFGHAFRIEEVAGGMQLLTRPQFGSWLRRLEHVPGEELLSAGMLETLSIVAYRQPVLRAEIEGIRGVSCDEVLRQLMQRDLVRIAGRHEDLGRPYLYGTTRRFLQLFGLQSLDSLPRAHKIRLAEAETATRIEKVRSGSESGTLSGQESVTISGISTQNRQGLESDTPTDDSSSKR
jgi:segregation and condensation protein B